MKFLINQNETFSTYNLIMSPSFDMPKLDSFFVQTFGRSTGGPKDTPSPIVLFVIVKSLVNLILVVAAAAAALAVIVLVVVVAE